MRRIKHLLLALAVVAGLMAPMMSSASAITAQPMAREACNSVTVAVYSSGTYVCFSNTGISENVHLPNTTKINSGGYSNLYVSFWECPDHTKASCNYYARDHFSGSQRTFYPVTGDVDIAVISYQ